MSRTKIAPVGHAQAKALMDARVAADKASLPFFPHPDREAEPQPEHLVELVDRLQVLQRQVDQTATLWPDLVPAPVLVEVVLVGQMLTRVTTIRDTSSVEIPNPSVWREGARALQKAEHALTKCLLAWAPGLYEGF